MEDARLTSARLETGLYRVVVDASLSPTSPEASSGRGLGWALALVGPAGATGLALLLGPVLQPHVLPPFLLAIAGAALIGGLGPGLAAAVLSGLAANYWFFPPPERLGFISQPDLVAQLVFWACSVLVASLCAWSRAWRLRAENEAGALAAQGQADRAEMVRMELALDRAALEDAAREQAAREQAAREQAARERAARDRAAIEEAVRAESARERAALEEPPGPERTAIVADDDADARQLACHALEAAGFRWLSACDATEALELLDRYDFPIELALIETNLPDMTGQGLADQMKARHPGIAVLYTSLSLAEVLVEQGLLEPGEPLIRKPFTGDGLLRMVRAITDQNPSAEPADAFAVPREER
jgi:CheY-like chemotaxis protein